MRKNLLIYLRLIRRYLTICSCFLLFSGCAVLQDFKYKLDASSAVEQYFIPNIPENTSCSRTLVHFDEKGIIVGNGKFEKECPKEPVICYGAERHSQITEYIREIAEEYYQ